MKGDYVTGKNETGAALEAVAEEMQELQPIKTTLSQYLKNQKADEPSF